MLNNREAAILFWIVLAVSVASTQRDIRSSFVGVFRALASPKILAPLGLMAGWVAFEVWLGSLAGIWTPGLLKDTAIWFITSGLVLFFGFSGASKDPNFFRKKVAAALLPIALLGVMLDAFVFSLIVEIVLQLILVVLVILAAAASMEKTLKIVEKTARGAIGIVGLLLIARAAVKLITQWNQLDKIDLVLEAVLPAWLTIGLLPFIYMVALYAAYEMAFARVNWKSSAGRLARLRTEIALLMSLHVNIKEISSFTGPWPQRLAATPSFNEVRRVVRDFRDARRGTARAGQEALHS